MPTLPLTNPTAIARSGSTNGWVLVGVPISAGYDPGSKSELLGYQLQPSSPLPALPAFIVVDLTSAQTTGTRIVDDIVEFGDASGPLSANSATLSGVGVRRYFVPSAFTLANLNAGNVWLWLGWKSIPTDPNAYSGWTVNITPASPVTVTSAVTATSNPTFTIDLSKVGFTDDYVDVELHATSTGDGDAVAYVGTSASVTNGLGASDSGAIAKPAIFPTPVQRQADSTVTRTLAVTSGTAQTTTSPTGTATLTTPNARVVHELTATVVNPPSADLTLPDISASYQLAGDGNVEGGLTAPRLSGLIVEEDPTEMTTRYIDDLVTFYAQLTQYSTGAAIDGTGSPAYRVYEESTGTPIATGSMALLDDAGTTGFYSGSFTASAGAGYEVGKTYCVRAAATVDGVAQAGICHTFVIRANPATAATNAAAVWAEAITEPSDLHPGTYGPLTALTLAYLRNLQVQEGNVTTLWGTGDLVSDPALGQQGYAITATGFVRAEATDA